MDDTEYHRVYNLARYFRRRAAAVAKLGGTCVECGTTEDLQFDHVVPESKTFEISQLLTGSESALQEELTKCQLLCRNHHEAKSASEKSVEHGGGLSGKKNCPCAPCKERKAEYTRSYRAPVA